MKKLYAIYKNQDWTFSSTVNLKIAASGFETEQSAEAHLLEMITGRGRHATQEHYFIVPYYIKK